MLAALLAHAAGQGVRHCHLPEIPPGSPLRHAHPPEGWTATWSENSPCPVLTLPGIPAPIRRKLRMNRNRADRAGGWTVEHATPETLDHAIDSLIALHAARWALDGAPGVLHDPAIQAFHRRAMPALLHAGLLRLAVLRLAGQVAAVVMALLDAHRIHFYLSGYDPAHSFVSPGTLLIGAMLDHAIEEGRTEAHFLRGQEPYKYRWGATDRLNATASFTT